VTDRSTALSKTVSHALRHEPWVYELELDDAGWVPVDALLRALRDLRRWRDVQHDDLVSMVASSTKRRYEIDGGRIRALYGHSVPGRIATVRADPPEVLFHGTSPAAWESIRERALATSSCAASAAAQPAPRHQRPRGSTSWRAAWASNKCSGAA